ncbi:MAG: PKD domain-containing protein [Chitinophagaceae bacterium]|nr:PKD domain-containing protein [Chitinophagaceae bacterium]
MKKYSLLALLLIITVSLSFGQDFSNKGKDFWVGYGSHVAMYTSTGAVAVQTTNGQNMVLYFTSDKDANVTVTIPATGWTKTYKVLANTVITSDIIPKNGTDDARLAIEGKSKMGIHVTSDENIIAYAHIYDASVSGASLLFPTPTLGREYYSINYKQSTNANYSYCYAFVIATEDSTNIEIVLAANSILNKKGDTIKTTLNKGEIYNVMGKLLSSTSGEDLTGTKIRSVATATSACKRIAVFSGSGKVNIQAATESGGSADNYIQQAFPSNAWGKRYLTAPTSFMPYNFFRIVVSDPTTIVKRNGVVLTGLVNNFYYDFGGNTPNLIESDKPIMVAQYITTADKAGNVTRGQGDPEMIYLSPIEQTINKVTIFSTGNYRILTHYSNLVIPKGGASTLKIDGITPTVTPIIHPQDANYFYYQIPLTVGYHTFESDSGFNAIAYGYGNAESYGYNAGANVKDLYQFLSLGNDYTSTTTSQPNACLNSPFRISITLPYQPLSIKWTIPNYPVVNDTKPVADTSFDISGRNVYQYKLPLPYSYATKGTYPVQVLVNNPTADGCSGEQIIDFDLGVFDPPIANFGWNNNGCVTDSIKFSDSSNANGRTLVKYYWDFGDGDTSMAKNPTHLFKTSGTYTVKLSVLTDIGCISQVFSKNITVDPVPTASFINIDSTCQNNFITFADSSKAYDSSRLVKWTWDPGDGTALIIDTTNASIKRKYTNLTTYNPTLQVQTATGCKSPIFTLPFVNHPNPIVDFKLPIVCLPDGMARFMDLSSIVDKTENDFKYDWKFGDVLSIISNPDTSSQKNPIHRYTNLGNYPIQLKVTSIYGCIDSTTKSLIEVYPQPKTNFDVSNEVCLRDSTVFTNLSDGLVRPLVSRLWTISNGYTDTSFQFKKVFSPDSTYHVSLYSISDKGCVSDTLTKSFVVNPLPTPFFKLSDTLCETNAIVITDSSVANVGNLKRWNWDLGDGYPNMDKTTSAPYNHTYTVWGDKTIKLMVETDKGCKSDTIYKTIRIHPHPLVNFSLPKICLPDGVGQFIDSTTIADISEKPFSFKWKFGDPFAGLGNEDTANIFNPKHRYSATGPYPVTLIVTTPHGCIDSTVKNITEIYAQPKTAFTVSPEVCLRDTTFFVNQSDGKGSPLVSRFWNFSDGRTDTTLNIAKVFLPNKTYTATLFSISDQGCNSDTVTHSFIVHPLPTPVFTTSDTLCEINAMTIKDASIANVGSLKRWNWDFGDGTPITDKITNEPFIHTYTVWGDKTIKLMVETDKGCKSDTLFKTFRVNPLPNVYNILPEVCLSDASALFLDSSYIADKSEIGFKYTWNFGDINATMGNPNISNLKNPSHRYSAAGYYNLSLKVQTLAGCSDSSTRQFTVNGSKPEAAFNILNNNALCSNIPIVLENNSTVDFGNVTKLVIYWDNETSQIDTTYDDNPTLNKTYTHLYPNFQNVPTKTFEIRLRAYSGSLLGDCFKDFIQTITIKGSPVITFDSIPGICFDAISRQITQTKVTDVTGIPAGSGIYSGTAVSTTGLFTPAIAGVDTFKIRYTYTASNGCNTFKEMPIVVWPRPVSVFGYSNPTCEKNPIVFTDSSISNATSLTTWKWDMGDGTALKTLNNNNPLSNTYPIFKSYAVTLQVINDRGCTSIPITQNVDVHPIPKVNFGSSVVCLPDGKAIFTDSTTILGANQAPFSYRWNFGDPNDPTGSIMQNPIHKYSALQSYNVKLIVTSVDGCIDSTTKVLSQVYAQSKAGFSSVDSVCVGFNIDFKDTTKDAVRNITKWYWDFKDGISSTLQNPTHLFKAAGTYRVALFTYTDVGCVSDTAQKTIVINPYPVISAGPDMFVLEGGQKMISATATGNRLVYNWAPQTYLNNPFILNPTILDPKNDIYYTLSVMGVGGCVTNDELFVKVLKLPKAPNTFTPNNDGINDTWVIKYLDSYPGAVLEIFTAQGQLVLHTTNMDLPWDGTYNGKPMPAGTYYYVLNPKNGREKVSGFVTILR